MQLSILQQISMLFTPRQLEGLERTFNSIVDQLKPNPSSFSLQNMFFQFYSRLAPTINISGPALNISFQFYSRLAVQHIPTVFTNIFDLSILQQISIYCCWHQPSHEKILSILQQISVPISISADCRPCTSFNSIVDQRVFAKDVGDGRRCFQFYSRLA